MSAEISLHRIKNRAAEGFVRFGSYWGKGILKRERIIFSAADETGKPVELQSEIRATWPDGSVKWAAHVADAGLLGEKATVGANDMPAGQELSQSDCALPVKDTGDSLEITAGSTSITIPKKGDLLFSGLKTAGREHAGVSSAYSVLLLEHRSEELTEDGIPVQTVVEEFRGHTRDAEVVTNGALCVTVRISGVHVSLKDGHEQIPFTLFAEIFRDSGELRFTYTFFYDADEKKDFLKGLGITFETPVEGAVYNHHVKFGMDHGYFSESPALLLSWRPRVPQEIYRDQIAGHFLKPDADTAETVFGKVAENIPVWSDYVLWQDSASHFVIRKRTGEKDCCYIEGVHGGRTNGVMALGGENGGIILGLRDFWQKYPSTLAVRHMDTDAAKAQIWFYSPEQEAYDLRHYATRGYSQVYYEGFDEFGATPFGIACTSSFSLETFTGEIPSDEVLDRFHERVQSPAVYVADPEYYHEHRAFGYWSLPGYETEGQKQLEEELEKTAGFYLEEVERRNWYGLFNYGDFMHTYDPDRHMWRYDMGGYAWDNTELVPTLWLWYYFLRTGREDIFTLAEALSRHTSEVDVYHFGPLQGLGSRHNVRHWGCPCKEARIAMAGHHRFLYYLTGDYRLGDVFDEVRDADHSTVYMDPLRFFFDKDTMVYPTHARSGPDWSSYDSNWMTAWERTGDSKWGDKIRVGIEDLYGMPMKLVSGSDFEYEPSSGHLRYIGDRATGGTHLEICQGAEQVWLELTDLMEDERWNRMLADFGAFYPLSHEEQLRLTNGMIKEREFTYPFMAAGIIAYGAYYYKDHALGKKVWEILRGCMKKEFGEQVLSVSHVKNAGNQELLTEMPGVSTNVMAQWSLNVIVSLEFVKDDLP